MPFPLTMPTTKLQSSYFWSVIMVLLAGLFWSFMPIGIRQFEQATVWHILLFRSIGLVPVVFVLLALQSGGKPLTTIRQSGWHGIVGGAALVCAYAGAVGAVTLTNVANAAFLFATAPFMVALLAWLILKEAIRRTTLTCLFIALVGVSVMVWDSVNSGNWLGDCLALLSALGFAIFTVVLRHGRVSNMLPLVLSGGIFTAFFAAIVLLVMGVSVVIPWAEIGLALALGAFLLGFGMALYIAGSKQIPAAELALLCMVEVVLAPIWAWSLLSELPTFAVILGGGIMVCAIIWNALSGMRRVHFPATF